MSLGKSRQCSESCLDYLTIEIVNYFSQQKISPPQAAIDAIGFRVGKQLIERYTINKPLFGSDLDVIKFICKEFWNDLFRKQVDNLRTNHRGTYVLKDTDFQWLRRLSLRPSDVANTSSAEVAKDFLHLPCSLIRGALIHLGVDCTIAAEAIANPQGGHTCDFTVTIKPK